MMVVFLTRLKAILAEKAELQARTGWLGFTASLVSSLASLATSYWAGQLQGRYRPTIALLLAAALACFVWQVSRNEIKRQ